MLKLRKTLKDMLFKLSEKKLLQLHELLTFGLVIASGTERILFSCFICLDSKFRSEADCLFIDCLEAYAARNSL